MDTLIHSITGDATYELSISDAKQRILNHLNSFTGNTVDSAPDHPYNTVNPPLVNLTLDNTLNPDNIVNPTTGNTPIHMLDNKGNSTLSMQTIVHMLRNNQTIDAEVLMAEYAHRSRHIAKGLAQDAAMLMSTLDIQPTVTNILNDSLLIAEPRRNASPPVYVNPRKLAKKLARMYGHKNMITPPLNWFTQYDSPAWSPRINCFVDADVLTDLRYTRLIVTHSTRPIPICTRVLALAIAMHARNKELEHLIQEFTAWRRWPEAEFWQHGYLARLPEALVGCVCAYL
jgi:hypothetical protein